MTVFERMVTESGEKATYRRRGGSSLLGRSLRGISGKKGSRGNIANHSPKSLSATRKNDGL